jgi:uncharacterized membrane protein
MHVLGWAAAALIIIIARTLFGWLDRRAQERQRRQAASPGGTRPRRTRLSRPAATGTLRRLWARGRRYRPTSRPARNVNEAFEERATLGTRVADRVAATIGSWRFIIIQSVILGCWIVLNVLAVVQHWDPYPFILLNLMLSFQAAYAGPVIMMSQNRQAARDRLAAEEDYAVNRRAEEGVEAVLAYLEQQQALLLELLTRAGGTGPDPDQGLNPEAGR